MKSHSEATYWRTDKEWYKANYDTGKYELTPMAPPRAVKSFRLYQRQNKIRVVLQRLGIK